MEQTATQPKMGENIALEERVTVRTRYTGQHLRVVLERQIDGEVPGNPDAEYIRQVPQAELIIEAGTRVFIGRGGVRIETMEEE